jgi:hypothetical protein
MRRFLLLPAGWAAGLVLASMLVCSRADAAFLWYNGDYDGRDALLNQGPAGAAPARVYDDFIVPVGSIYTITSLFSNDFIPTPAALPTTDYWEIRFGISSGNAGTLVAGGISSTVTTSPTGRTEMLGAGVNYTEYTTTVSGLNIVLTAGTYYLTAAPNTPAGNDFADYSLIGTTSGAHAVGQPPGNDGNSFYTSSYFGLNYVPTSSNLVEGPGTWDYSMGISGTVALIPEPASAVQVLVGLGLMAAYLRAPRRRKS